MTGAWPPSSSEMRFSCPAARRINSLPTSVEPVKLSLRMMGFSIISSVNSVGREITRLTVPAGQPASSRH